MPIQRILSLFCHIFESESFDLMNLLFDALLIIFDVVQKYKLDLQVLDPVASFDFDILLDELPNQVQITKSKMDEIFASANSIGLIDE